MPGDAIVVEDLFPSTCNLVEFAPHVARVRQGLFHVAIDVGVRIGVAGSPGGSLPLAGVHDEREVRVVDVFYDAKDIRACGGKVAVVVVLEGHDDAPFRSVVADILEAARQRREQRVAVLRLVGLPSEHPDERRAEDERNVDRGLGLFDSCTLGVFVSGEATRDTKVPE